MAEDSDKPSKCKKDTRMHLAIKNPDIQNAIAQIMENEGLSQEEVIEKYMLPHLPRKPWEIVAEPYQKMCDSVAKQMFATERQPIIKNILGNVWSALMLIYKGYIDAENFRDYLSKAMMDPELRTPLGKQNLAESRDTAIPTGKAFFKYWEGQIQKSEAERTEKTGGTGK